MGWIRRAKGVKRGVDGGGSDNIYTHTFLKYIVK